jgi:hypothetical protein
MCCKLLEIDVMNIYETRPDPCRGFHCGYLRLADLGDHWKPAKAKFLINYESGSGRIAIHADPERPDAWKVDPYIKTIQQWSLNAARAGSYVIVWAGPNATLVLPGRYKDLGPVRDDQVIVAVDVPNASSTSSLRDFIAVEPDDPRAKRATT